jgi:hypothetical protein
MVRSVFFNCPHMKTIPLYSFLSGRGLSCPCPLQLQETSRKRLPSCLDSSWGPVTREVLGEGQRKNLCCGSCKKEEKLSRSPDFPPTCVSQFTPRAWEEEI